MRGEIVWSRLILLIVVILVCLVVYFMFFGELPTPTGTTYVIRSIDNLCGAMLEQGYAKMSAIVDGQLWMCVENDFIPDAKCWKDNEPVKCDCICYRNMWYG